MGSILGFFLGLVWGWFGVGSGLLLQIAFGLMLVRGAMPPRGLRLVRVLFGVSGSGLAWGWFEIGLGLVWGWFGVGLGSILDFVWANCLN